MVNLLKKLARLAGFKPATHGLEVKALELPNLLKLLEAIEITDLPFSLSFQILAGFGIFLNHFHTQIHTQQSALLTNELLTGLAPLLGHGHAVNAPTI